MGQSLRPSTSLATSKLLAEASGFDCASPPDNADGSETPRPYLTDTPLVPRPLTFAAFTYPYRGASLPVELPTDRDVYTTTVKVRFYELDPYDHVNHTNYFAYFETARIEYLNAMGWGLDMLKEQGWQLVVVEITARFMAAARYGQELTIHTWVEDAGRVKSTWRQTMLRGDEEVAWVLVTAAFTDLQGRPRRLPVEFTEHLGRRAE